MSQNILIAVFTDTSFSLISATTGSDPQIDTSLQDIYYQNDDSLTDIFSQNLSHITQDPHSKLALILPYSWIDSDGKINKQKNGLIVKLCQTNNLTPVGFMSTDEAVLDYFCHEQGIPSSPVLIEITNNQIAVSVSDMGLIKKRMSLDLNVKDNLPEISKNILNKLNPDSIISPKVFIWGKYTNQTVVDFNNYPWLNKSDPNVFLHFPDIVFLDKNQTNKIYLNAINFQISENVLPSQVENTISFDPPQIIDYQKEVEQTDFLDLGFSVQEENTLSLDPVEDIDKVPTLIEPASEMIQKISYDSSKTNNIAKVKPKLSHKKLYLIGLLSTLIFIPVLMFTFLYQVSIDIFISPVDINLAKKVTLSSDTKQSDFSQNIISVKNNQSVVNVTDQTKTTGVKTIGDKAQGKIAIFNKTEEAISLKKGQIFETANGVKIALLNDTQIDGSSLDLEEGLISMGKTTAIAQAQNIGPDGNLSESTGLKIDNLSDNILVAKVSESFSGGTSKQVKSVSEIDKQSLKTILEDKMSQNLAKSQPDSKNKYILKSTLKNSQAKIEYNREIGEESDILSATMESIVTYYSINQNEIDQIILYLSKDNINWKIDSNFSDIYFDFIKGNNSEGQLALSGKAVPILDFEVLSKEIAFKKTDTIINSLQKVFNRIYDFNIRTNNPFGKLPLMPIKPSNINFVIKTET